MSAFRKKVYACAGATSLFFGPGRKEFNPDQPMPSFETYLQETAQGTLSQIDPQAKLDEGIIGSFMAAQFLKQGNLPGFLPFMAPALLGKPCTAVEGACGTGGRAIAVAIRSVLSDLSDVVFVSGFEVQNSVKALYGADILAGAAYYKGERKKGHAFFFPGIFSDRAGAYYERYGAEKARKAMAKWYENAILNARKHPNAQEYQNKTQDLLALGMTPPNPARFLPYLNNYDCSKVSDGAASIFIVSEEGLKRLGIPKEKAIEIIGIGEAEGDITKPPKDPTHFTQTETAGKQALKSAHVTLDQIGSLELHDCFTISGLLALEAIGAAAAGGAPDFVLSGATTPQGKLPTNLSGGLIGFGHPTGASGVRMMVDLWREMTTSTTHSPYGMMVSMGGNDVTVTSFVVKTSV